MKINIIEKIIQIVEESNLTEFEWVTPEDTLKLKKNVVQTVVASAPQVISAVPEQVAVVPVQQSQESEPVAVECNLYKFKSPMVGSFYTTPEPDQPAFVVVGSSVKKGDVLCIIEAMKLMNEIESEVDGIIEEICVKNGEPVEYGSVLFKIKEK